MDHELHLRPRIQRLFWWLTLMWAALCLGRALMSLWLLLSQSVETFVLVKSLSMLTINCWPSPPRSAPRPGSPARRA